MTTCNQGYANLNKNAIFSAIPGHRLFQWGQQKNPYHKIVEMYYMKASSPDNIYNNQTNKRHGTVVFLIQLNVL